MYSRVNNILCIKFIYLVHLSENMSEDWSPTFTCQVQRKHRIWIPKTIRTLMKIDEGDYIEVKIRVIKREGLLRK